MDSEKHIQDKLASNEKRSDLSSITENGLNVEIKEYKTPIIDQDIGFCKYGFGKQNLLFICGGVGCYKKDYPEQVVKAFDPSTYTIVCIDPPGYGTSRPPDRKQEVNRCMKDAAYCLKLMQHLNLTPFGVLGWSEGSRTAVHVAGQGKELVKLMVLLAPCTRIDQRGAGIFRGMKNTNEWSPEAMEVYLRHYSKEFVSKQWADLCDVVVQVYELLGGRFPSDYVLPNLKIPTLIITGGMDRFCVDPKYFPTVLQNCITDCHSLGSHDLHIKYSRWFAERITRFINDST